MDKVQRKNIILLVVAIAVASIWIFKNVKIGEEAPTTPTAIDDGVFALEIETIDMEELTSHELPILLDFGSDGCGPCRSMAPALSAINVEMEGKALVKHIDVWAHKGVADDYPVRVIPTQLFINAGGTPYVPPEDSEIKFIIYTDKYTEKHIFTTHEGVLTQDEMRAILSDMGARE